MAAARRAEALRCAGVRLRCAVERLRLLAVERLVLLRPEVERLEFERVDVERLLPVERPRVLLVLLRRAVLRLLFVLRL